MTYTPAAASVAEKEVRPAEQDDEMDKVADDGEEDEGELVEEQDDGAEPSDISYVIKIEYESSPFLLQHQHDICAITSCPLIRRV